MKYFSLIALLFILSLASCDGKHRALETHDEKLEHSNLSATFFEQDSYVPEQFTASTTDTILNSGLRVNVNYYALMDNLVTVKSTDNPNVNTHYRKFESQIQVFKNNELLFNETLNTSEFADAQHSAFWDNAIMQYVWLDDLESTADNILINCSFLEPITHEYKSYKVSFNRFGTREITLIDAS